MSATTPFSAVLAELFGRLQRLHGIGLRWKDADRRLRRSMPRDLVEHRHPRCLASKGRDAASRERCVRHCSIDAEDWSASRPPARRSTCHAGCREWRVPVVIDGAIAGTLVLGPCRPGGEGGEGGEGGRGGTVAELPPAPDGIEELIALLAFVIPRLARERDRERGELAGSQRHPALLGLARLLQEPRHDRDAAALAERCGLSVSRLQHLCREQMGESLLHLRDAALLVRARELLDEDARSVAAVAAFLGFADQRYFATWFRRQCGLSPREWRRAQRRRDDV